MEGAHEHLEHVEHAEHAHNPFEKRVAVSIAIVAAVLAGISMLGHRKHNEVLQLQGDSNRRQTESNILHTKATDAWGEYQSVNIRDHGYEFTGIIMKEVAKGDPKMATALSPAIDRAEKKHKDYDKRLPDLKKKAEDLVNGADAKQKESLTKMADSEHAHHQADRLDYGHLGAEIGIVLCSLALLTKKKLFWLLGLGATLLAIAMVVSSYLLPHESHEALGNESGAAAH
jgi:hypothetical protein